jgi:hypothetical protein
MTSRTNFKEIVMTNLPSKGYPYPNGTILKVSEYLFNDMEFIMKNSGDELTLLEFYKDSDIIRLTAPDDYEEGSLSFEDLTVGDWLYTSMTMSNHSCLHLVYTTERECPKCKGKIDMVDLGVGGQSLPVAGDLVAELTPSQVLFNTLEPFKDGQWKGQMPIFDTINLSGNDYTLDFYRMGHYITHLREQKNIIPIVRELNQLEKQLEQLDPVTNLDDIEHANAEIDARKERLEELDAYKLNAYRELELMLGVDNFSGLSVRDVHMLFYLKEQLNHGPTGKTNAKCRICSHEDTIEINWGATDLLPFRVIEKDFRNVVRFGKRRPPGRKLSGKIPIHEDGNII